MLIPGPLSEALKFEFELQGIELLLHHYGIHPGLASRSAHNTYQKLALALARDFVPYFDGPGHKGGRAKKWTQSEKFNLVQMIKLQTVLGLTVNQALSVCSSQFMGFAGPASSLRRQYQHALAEFKAAPIGSRAAIKLEYLDAGIAEMKRLIKGGSFSQERIQRARSTQMRRVQAER